MMPGFMSQNWGSWLKQAKTSGAAFSTATYRVYKKNSQGVRSKIGGIGGSKQRSSDALGANFSTATYRVYKKLVGACEAKLGELVDIGSYLFNGNVQGIQKTSQGV